MKGTFLRAVTLYNMLSRMQVGPLQKIIVFLLEM